MDIEKCLKNLNEENATWKKQKAMNNIRNYVERSISKKKIQDKIDEYKIEIKKYNELKEKGIETDVEYYENISNMQIVKVLEELLKGDNNEQI